MYVYSSSMMLKCAKEDKPIEILLLAHIGKQNKPSAIEFVNKTSNIQ